MTPATGLYVKEGKKEGVQESKGKELLPSSQWINAGLLTEATMSAHFVISQCTQCQTKHKPYGLFKVLQ